MVSPSHFKKCVVYIISLYPKLSQNIQCNSNSNNSSPSYFNQHLLQNVVGDSHCLDLELCVKKFLNPRRPSHLFGDKDNQQ